MNWFLCLRPHATSKLLPWKVEMVLVESEELFMEAEGLGLLKVAGTNSPTSFPLPRLWSPNPVCVWIKDIILSQIVGTSDEKPLSTFSIVDVGCGVGRDLTFLAEEYLSACKKAGVAPVGSFVGIDNHKSTEKILMALSKNRNVKRHIKFAKQNLKQVTHETYTHTW